MNLTRKGGLAAIVVAALVAAGVVSTAPALAASATSTPPAGQCVVDTIHHDAQYKYSQFVPGHAETTRTENKYKQTATVYTIEHKDTGLPSSGAADVIAWYGTIGAVSQGDNFWQLPDSIVNAAGVNPFAVGQTGSVDLAYYGYPGHATVPYRITGIESFTTPPTGSLFVTNHNVTLYYTGSGIGSTSSGDAVWTATNPGSPWVTFGSSRTVGNGDAVADKTVFYLPGGGQSDTNTDANWTTETPGAPWTKIAGEEKAAYDEDIYGPCPQQPCIADFDPATGYVNPDEVGKEPTQVAAGLEFGKGDLIHFPAGLVSAVGLHDLAYTVVSSTGPSPAYKMEVFANGTTGYGTWNWEPSNNGFALNATGTFTNLENGKWWSSKIPSGPGSISQPIPYVDLVAIYGGLTKIISFGTGIGSTTESTAVVSSQTFLCGTGDFTKPPTEFEPASPTKVDVCGVANDSFTLPGAQPNELESITPEGTYTADDLPDVDGTVAVTLVPADDYAVKDDPNADYEVDKDGNAVWILVFTDEACPVAITPGGPTKTDVCGVVNDTFTLLGAKPGVRESVTSEGKYTATGDPAKGEDVVVTFTPNSDDTVKPSVDGSYEVVGGNAVWTLTYTNVSCPTPPGGLATTGSNPWPLIALIVALLAAGVYMTREGYWRRKTLQS